ncbi:MAG: ATP-binding protein [Alphaproteobacteria bacterium]|nr:ATP-binding protein [Alphaproteobacteria bacterium]
MNVQASLGLDSERMGGHISASSAVIQLLLDAMSGSCALLDGGGVIRAVNAEWREFAEKNGYRTGPGERGFGVGQNYFGICEDASGSCADGAVEVVSGMRGILTGRIEVFEYEYPCHSPSQQRWYKCIVKAFAAADTSCRWLLVQHVDMTKHVLIRRNAKASLDRLDGIAVMLGMESWRLATDDVLEISDRLRGRLAIEDGRRLLLDDWFAGLRVADRNGLAHSIDMARKHPGEIQTSMFQMAMPTGAVKRFLWLGVESVAIESGLGEIVAYVCSLDDRHLSALAESLIQSQFEQVLNRMPIRIAGLGLDCRYDFANEEFLERVSVERDEIVGQHVRDVLGPEAWLKLEPKIRHALAGNVVEFETTLSLKDGTRLDLDITYIPRHSPAGEVDGFYAIVKDIGKHKDRERDLKRLREEADQANQAKSRFLACASHDLRTPLNAIIGFSDLMLEPDTRLPEAVAHEYLGYIRDSGKTLLGIVNQLLDLSELESGKRKFNPKSFSLRTEVEACQRSLTHACEGNGVVLTVNDLTRCPLVHSDQLAVRQIVQNLATNAVKFVGAGGTVGITLVEAGNRLKVTVADNGPGIPAEQLERVLMPFEKGAYDVARSSGEGYGLGLSICNTLATSLGGSLEIESQVGAGTDAILTLPKVMPGGTPIPCGCPLVGPCQSGC